MITYESIPGYVMREIAGDYVLIKALNSDVGNTNVYVFNDSGAFLWNNLSEKKTKDQLVMLLTNKYGIDQLQSEADVLRFIDKCLSEGFIFENREGEQNVSL